MTRPPTAARAKNARRSTPLRTVPPSGGPVPLRDLWLSGPTSQPSQRSALPSVPGLQASTYDITRNDRITKEQDSPEPDDDPPTPVQIGGVPAEQGHPNQANRLPRANGNEAQEGEQQVVDPCVRTSRAAPIVRGVAAKRRRRDALRLERLAFVAGAVERFRSLYPAKGRAASAAAEFGSAASAQAELAAEYRQDRAVAAVSGARFTPVAVPGLPNGTGSELRGARTTRITAAFIQGAFVYSVSTQFPTNAAGALRGPQRTRHASSWRSWVRTWTQLPRFRTRCVRGRR
jgi:hypothetical protein